MTGFLLAINMPDLHALKQTHQIDQGHFTAIGYPAEHGFPKKETAHAHAIQPAYQHTIPPHFNTVGMATVVPRDIGLLHFGRYPGDFTLIDRFGTFADHILKRRVHGHVKGWLLLPLSALNPLQQLARSEDRRAG